MSHSNISTLLLFWGIIFDQVKGSFFFGSLSILCHTIVQFRMLVARFQNLGEMMTLGRNDAAISPSFIDGLTLEGPIGHAGKLSICSIFIFTFLNNLFFAVLSLGPFPMVIGLMIALQQGNWRT